MIYLFMIYLSPAAAGVASHNDKFTSDINLKVDGGGRGRGLTCGGYCRE